jgi:hypothetical protein
MPKVQVHSVSAVLQTRFMSVMVHSGLEAIIDTGAAKTAEEAKSVDRRS